jgi:LPXTG-motif cell wall-anchored protein
VSTYAAAIAFSVDSVTTSGIVLGGILGLVVLLLAGGYLFIRWRRSRIKKPSRTGRSQTEIASPTNGPHVVRILF